jgi:septum formation protein
VTSKRISPSSPLVLGSGSPRRREILASLRIASLVRPPDVDEDVHGEEDPQAYLRRVVLAKLDAVRALLTPEEREASSVVLTCDTSVIDGRAILGKPANAHEAEEMITRLAGRTHDVLTGFALASTANDPPFHVETVATRVTFRPLDLSEIQAYAASGEGLDKAGGYAAQGLGASLIARIDGSYTNVVGLPACELVVALRHFGKL